MAGSIHVVILVPGSRDVSCLLTLQFVQFVQFVQMHFERRKNQRVVWYLRDCLGWNSVCRAVLVIILY